MTNAELKHMRNEAHYCQKPECGEHLALHTGTQCPVERYTDGYKPLDQRRHDHRSAIDFWLAMKDDER